MISLNLLNNVLHTQRDHISREWLKQVLEKWNNQYQNLLTEQELKTQSDKLLEELTRLLLIHKGNDTFDIAISNELSGIIKNLSISRAKLGFKVTDTATYILTLKNVLTKALMEQASTDQDELVSNLLAINSLLDRLSILIFDSFISQREEIISQQSLSIQELSTPVIRLWDQIVLLPLVGVIDTLRARQFTENLLEAISRYEAVVTVIDVTGVPVFDTSVARHIMKTVDAAQLLGSRIIMTGISPEGALTLTKLGLNFSATICRASLRAGVAEALKMIGKRINLIEAAK